MASETPKYSTKICLTPNCGKRLCARGFCVSCYYKSLRRGSVIARSATKRWKHRLKDINIEKKNAICLVCGPVKINSRGNGQWRCAIDTNERSKLYKRAYREEKRRLLLTYCEICGCKDVKLCYDHSHTTGKFRGTLCGKCNSAIGLFGDNEKVIESARRYICERGK